MSDALELSRFLGKPVRLFRFERQGLVWRYCTAPADMTIDGVTYLAGQIDRSEIKQTVERAKDKIEIKLAYLRDPNAPAEKIPSTQPLGGNWHPYTPSDEIRVVCLATHVGSLDPPRVEWMGIVAQPAFTDTELTLTCEPGPATPRARNQGPKWQKGCWKTVYSTGPRGCGLALDAFEVATTLTSVDGLVLTGAAFATAPLNLRAGWVEWTRADGLLERRSITAHDGDKITVLYGAADLAADLAVVARPGCPQTWDGCTERFPTPEDPPANHYGGAMYKPVKNPHDGESMSWG